MRCFQLHPKQSWTMGDFPQIAILIIDHGVTIVNYIKFIDVHGIHTTYKYILNTHTYLYIKIKT